MSRKKNKPNTAEPTGQKPEIDTTANIDAKAASKKAAVLGTGQKGHRPLAAIIACAILIAGGAYFVIQRMDAGSRYAPAVQAPASDAAAATQFAYPLSLFEDGNARHFEYKGPAGTIRYFILKSSDGVLRAAFDACDVCWRAGKGYYQVGDYMVCGNCGQKFASIRVNEVKGGCNPSPLNRSVEGGEVVIRVNDIIQGAQYFNFSGRT